MLPFRLGRSYSISVPRLIVSDPVIFQFMRDETQEKPKKLRSGYTTGACATATSFAAAHLLLSKHTLEHVTIQLPRGENVVFRVDDIEILHPGRATASTIKDAGDDPDATHGATVFAEVELSSSMGVRFHAGAGVGTVTRVGLSIPVGEPAINPVPRQMIGEHLERLALEHSYPGGFEVHIGIVNGEEIAKKTMNGRLGILGGLSILGTTGIVRPYSCAAYIASIHQGIDVAHAGGFTHIAACTGSTSEKYVSDLCSLPDTALIEMGDFAGAVLKHLRKVPMERLSICGGFGKMSKLAAGHTSLHSKDSSINFEQLAEWTTELGADVDIVQQVRVANTSIEALEIVSRQQIPLGDHVAKLAKQQAAKVVRVPIKIDVYCIDRKGEPVGSCSS